MVLNPIEVRQFRIADDPFSESTLMGLVAVGITRIAWRDSPLEDWHANRRHALGQGEMMRATAATCRLVLQLLLSHSDLMESAVSASPILKLVCDAIFDPQRILPDGRTLSELAGDNAQLASLRQHTDECARRWTRLVNHRGSDQVLLELGYLGAVRNHRWWLTPSWPERVDNFLARIHNPPTYEDDRLAAYYAQLQRPADIRDDDTLRRQLLAGPDSLSGDAAHYCAAMGIGDIDLTDVVVDRHAYRNLALLYEPDTPDTVHKWIETRQPGFAA